MNWNGLLKSFENYLRLEKAMSEHSIAAYVSDTKQLSDFFPNKTPQSLKTEDLLEVNYELAKLINPKTQARKLSAWKQFYDYLILSHRIDHNPCKNIENPKYHRKLPDTLSLDEIDQIVNSFDLSKALSYRNRAIVELLYSCGLRVSELCELKLSNIYKKEQIIRVLGKGNKQRLIPIAQYTLDVIDEYLEFERAQLKIQDGHQDTLFLNRRGKGLTRVMIFTMIKNQVSLCGIKKNVSPHTFRHSFASHLLADGADLVAIQQMLGHQNLSTTEVYLHIDQSKVKEILENFHPRGKN